MHAPPRQTNPSLAKFNGRIILVEDDFHVDKWVGELRKFPALGFDLEWQPEESSYVKNPIATIQLSSMQLAVIFHVIKMPKIPESLKTLLSDPTVKKIGQGVGTADTQKLEQAQLEVQGMEDLQDSVREFGFQKFSLQFLVATILNQFLDKRMVRSDWSQRLSFKQKLYAATDAWVTLYLYNHLANLRSRVERNSNFPPLHEFGKRFCFICEGSFNNWVELQKHTQNDHVTLNRCHVCDRIFETDTGLQRHMDDKHNGKKFECFTCGKLFLTKIECGEHMEAAGHQMPDEFYCSKCDREFSKIEGYKSHMVSVHGGDKRTAEDANGEEEENGNNAKSRPHFRYKPHGKKHQQGQSQQHYVRKEPSTTHVPPQQHHHHQQNYHHQQQYFSPSPDLPLFAPAAVPGNMVPHPYLSAPFAPAPIAGAYATTFMNPYAPQFPNPYASGIPIDPYQGHYQAPYHPSQHYQPDFSKKNIQNPHKNRQSHHTPNQSQHPETSQTINSQLNNQPNRPNQQIKNNFHENSQSNTHHNHSNQQNQQKPSTTHQNQSGGKSQQIKSSHSAQNTQPYHPHQKNQSDHPTQNQPTQNTQNQIEKLSQVSSVETQANPTQKNQNIKNEQNQKQSQNHKPHQQKLNNSNQNPGQNINHSSVVEQKPSVEQKPQNIQPQNSQPITQQQATNPSQNQQQVVPANSQNSRQTQNIQHETPSQPHRPQPQNNSNFQKRRKPQTQYKVKQNSVSSGSNLPNT